MSPGTSVLYEVSDGVAVVTLNRPDALNAIDAGMREELPEVITEADRDRDVRVIVLRGAGERAFCAGADVKEFVAPDSLVAARAARQATKWTDLIAGADKPTLASIHGFCLGGGLEIALACDVRIAADDATFALPEVRLGIIPGAGGTQRLPRIVGVGHALRLTLTGDRVDAAEAHRMGLVSEVAPRSDLEDVTRQWAARLCEGAPRAVAYAKEAIHRGSDLPLAEGLRFESDLSTILLTTKDRLEGAAAFRERRKPSYQGE